MADWHQTIWPQRTWHRVAALALLAVTLSLGGCSARSGAGDTAAAATARASQPQTPAQAAPTATQAAPTATTTSTPEPATVLLPTPTPDGAGVDQGLAVSLPTPTPAATAPEPAPTAEAAAPASAPPAPAAQPAGPSALLLDLPALVITYDDNGTPSVGDSTPLTDLAALLPPALISQLTLDAALIERATAAGLQHVMVSNTPQGLRVLVNGQPLPALVWDQQSLDNLLQLLGPAGDALPATLRDLLPLLTNLGVGLVVQLPRGEAPAIPLIVRGAQSNAAQAQTNLAAFLARAGGAPVVHISVTYAPDGTWNVGGMSDTEWQALTGLPFGYVRLNPALLRGAAAAGIQQVVVWTDAEGLHVTIGDRDLPYLRWADGGIHTLIDLLLRLDMLGGAAGDQQLIDLLLAQWLPALQATDLRIVVDFPEE